RRVLEGPPRFRAVRAREDRETAIVPRRGVEAVDLDRLVVGLDGSLRVAEEAARVAERHPRAGIRRVRFREGGVDRGAALEARGRRPVLPRVAVLRRLVLEAA